MKKTTILHLLGGLLLLSLAACSTSFRKSAEPILEVPFTQVHLDDPFWTPRIETNRTVSIPSAFRECEVNGRFDNFALAGGLIQGEHKGDFSFDDTDPYKIIEGASYSLAAHYDKALDAYLDSVIAVIAAAQESDGYLTTCVTNRCQRLAGWWGTHRWDKINSHELYNSGHLYEAAVAHYQATGKRSLLDVAIRNADLVCRTFGTEEGQVHRPSGHPIVEMALCKLYKVTGNEQYLQTARYFVEETGRCSDGHRPSAYSQDHMPILKQTEIVGHAVRAGYLYSGVADVAALQADTAYFHALERLWDNLTGCKLYITGGMGSRAQGEGFGPNYELHNHTAYCETCAAIANVYWNHRMFLATGEAKYADVVERALYNGVVSGVSLSGDRFFYDNPLESMGEHERQAWFGCACCPGNITRFVASVPQYMYATQGDDVYVNLYIQGESTLETTHHHLTLTQQTDYPWQGDVDLTLHLNPTGRFALRLRIPGWAQDKPVPSDLYTFTDEAKPWTVKVNGRPAKAELIDGYATLYRTWHDGDRITLSLPMEARQIQASDSVKDDRGKLAIERGPIVYCLEGIDQADSTVFDKFIPRGTAMTAHHDARLLGGVTTLSGKAQQVEKDGTVKEVTFRAVPYCTWNNRGTGEMAVWMPAQKDGARPTPEPTIASSAEMYSLPTGQTAEAPAATSNLQEAWGFNDQWDPTASNDTSKPYHYWWLREGSEENVCYRFDKAYRVASVDVYWLDFDHYDGNYRVPAAWTLYYKTGNRWMPVKAKGEYPLAKDAYNHLDFEPVTTTDLMIVARLQKGASGGVIEWKVNN